jgi:hypothetical protein
MLKHILRGVAAGAAGTTALNAVTYLDMVLRGRGASSTPEESVRHRHCALCAEACRKCEDTCRQLRDHLVGTA